MSITGQLLCWARGFSSVDIVVETAAGQCHAILNRRRPGLVHDRMMCHPAATAAPPMDGASLHKEAIGNVLWPTGIIQGIPAQLVCCCGLVKPDTSRRAVEPCFVLRQVWDHKAQAQLLQVQPFMPRQTDASEGNPAAEMERVKV